MHFSKMRTACSSSRLCWRGLPKCMLGYTPLGVGLETPPGVGLDDTHPLGCGPADPTSLGVSLQSPSPSPRCGPGDPPGQTPQLPPCVWVWRLPPGQTPQLPPWVWAWRPARHAGILPSPVNRMTDRTRAKT